MNRAPVRAACGLLGVLLGCASFGAQHPGDSQTALTEPYPAGRWRLAPREDLAHVVLWVSHILVRHEGVRPGVVSFYLPDWTPEHARPTRTRVQAFSEAQRLAQRLRDDPESFARVAREESEDLATRSLGGSLGGITAIELSHRYPQVLDALAALDAGQVSRVVETAHGFHVFLRRSPPPLEMVSGARIVIGYDDAPWLPAFMSRRDIPKRTRVQALELAEAVYARARDGEDFASLVDTYSDHEDVLRGGDFGEWSTRRPTPYPREVDMLRELEVGEVAAPIESPFGVEIIARTPNRPRRLYAMSTVEQLFAGPLKGSELPTKAALLATMTKLADDVRRNPGRFSELQREYCCPGIQQWPEGQGSAFAERALAPLEPGQIAPSVVELNGACALVRRENPTSRPEAAISFELPSPVRPYLPYLARTGFFAARLHDAAAAASLALHLSEPVAGRFAELHEIALQSMVDSASMDEQEQRYAELVGSVRNLLGPPAYDAYLAFLERYYSDLLLRQ